MILAEQPLLSLRRVRTIPTAFGQLHGAFARSICQRDGVSERTKFMRSSSRYSAKSNDAPRARCVRRLRSPFSHNQSRVDVTTRMPGCAALRSQKPLHRAPCGGYVPQCQLGEGRANFSADPPCGGKGVDLVILGEIDMPIAPRQKNECG